MNNFFTYSTIFVLMAGFSLSCTKTVTSVNPPVVTDSVILGKITYNKDTGIVKIADIQVSFYSTSPCYPGTEIFYFTATVANVPANASYIWYFGDGYTASGLKTQHSYDATSPYVVMLDVRSSTGELLKSGSFSLKAWGKQIKPEAIFSTKSDFTTNLNYVTFNSASGLNKGSIVNYFWFWGDGSHESSAVGLTRHQFPSAITDKTYSVTLIITSDAGCTDDTTVNVTIPATYPITGDFNAAAFDACTNEHFVFTAQATSVPTGSIYVWNFSDGLGTVTGNPVNYKYKYMNDYDVIMQIFLNNRLIYSTHKVVGAKGEDPKPAASFYYEVSSTTTTTQKLLFNSKSTIPHGGIDGYYWSFGDGNTDNQYNSPTYNTYNRLSSNKDYNVRLIVTGNGCADTTYKTVNIPAQ
jgi:hypothetical protein